MYYFASDIHLGAGSPEERRRTEREFVAWLRRVGEDAEAIFLCGDIFDFWFEYKEVIPKGFARTFGALSELTDRGVRVVFMAGNHDMWVGNYLSEECGLELYTAPRLFELGGKRVYVAHGDNLNVKGNWRLRAINRIFRSKLAFKLFSTLIHPDAALRFGHAWSDQSRTKHDKFEGLPPIENGAIQALIEHSQAVQRETPCDLYIYGHLHIPFEYHDAEGLNVLFTNDWKSEPQYIRMSEDGEARLEKLNNI